MWPDNETDIDFLNFTSVADTVAEIVVQAKGRPISIGVSGAWGVGKSSMIKLVHKSLNDRDDSNFLFVEFNAWLYQGYDDVRAALLEIIAGAIQQRAEQEKTGIEKASELVKRVNWLRVAKLTAGTAASVAFGLPPVGLIGEVLSLSKAVVGDNVDAEVIKQMEKTGSDLLTEASGLIKERKTSSPPKEIHAIRAAFEEALEALDVTLVVLIDDLDRCLPETTISTLEAIRLFLFLKSTAFVVAADNEMIKHAARRHFDFEGVDDRYITSYFDKLIQVPIRVPPLGTQEVRAYLMLLFVETSELTSQQKVAIREQVCQQLSKSWKGARVDRAFMNTLGIDFDVDTIARFDAADRLAPLMVSATDIKGNPRLIKRFLNALSIRMAIARANDIDVDEAVLAKLLLFERCGSSEAYSTLIESVSMNDEGKPAFLGEWEDIANEGKEPLELDKPWDDPFFAEWLAIPPRMADSDLRGALYVSREHAPLILPEDRLSSEGIELLKALLEHPDMGADLIEQLRALPRPETAVILDRLLERARREQEWGTPHILDACLAVTRADESLGSRLAGFLVDRPAGQIAPSIVPKIGGEPWCNIVFSKWQSANVAKPVKAAINKRGQDGDI